MKRNARKKQVGMIIMVFTSMVILCVALTACGYTGKNYDVTIKKGPDNTLLFDQKNFVGQQNLPILMYDSLIIHNTSNETLTLTTTPGGGLPANSVLQANNSLTATFDHTGTWTISSKEHPELKLTVVVQQ